VYKFVLKNTIKVLLDLILLIIIGNNLLWVFRNDGLRDFGSFIAAGQAANLGENPYQVDNPNTFVATFAPLNLKVPSYNLNPPISVLFFQFLAKFNPLMTYRLWQGFSILCYTLLVLIYRKCYPNNLSFHKILWAFSLAGLWHTIELGQIYLPFLLLYGIALILLDKDKYDWFSGILLGICIAIKPNFILLAIFLLLIKKYRPSIIAFCSAALISIIPIMFYGMEIYRQWREAVASYSGYAIPGNNSLMGLLIRFGLENTTPIFIILMVLFGLYTVWKNQYDVITTGTMALIITLLISPVAWPGYMTFLLPILLKNKWDTLMTISSGILVIPVTVIYANYHLSPYHLVLIGWLYGWSMLILLIAILRNGKTYGLIHEKTS
jgi:hypothetical protein